MPLKTHVNFKLLETLLDATGEFYICRCPVSRVLSRIRESVIFFAFEPHYEVILNTNSGTLVPEKLHFFCNNTLQGNHIPETADTIVLCIKMSVPRWRLAFPFSQKIMCGLLSSLSYLTSSAPTKSNENFAQIFLATSVNECDF